MFVHCMPDLDTLELLGFRAYPRWFREMPRDFQVSNSTEFNEAGLDPHRGSQWRNGGMRVPQGVPQNYSPSPNGPQGGNFGIPQQQVNPGFTNNRFGPAQYASYQPGQGFIPRGPQAQQFPQANGFQSQSPFGGAQNGQGPAQNGHNGRNGPVQTLPNGTPSPPGFQYGQAQTNNVNMQGMPFGRMFVPGAPGSGPSDNSPGIRVNTPGTDVISTGTNSPTMSDYHRRNSIFSSHERDIAASADLSNSQWKVLTPVPQPTKPVSAPPTGPNNNQKPNQPQHRSLYDGAPPSPEPKHTKRFTDPKFKASKFIAPDQQRKQGGKGNGSQTPKAGKGNKEGASKGGKALPHSLHAPTSKATSPKTTSPKAQAQPKSDEKVVIKEEPKSPKAAAPAITNVEEGVVLVDVVADA